MNILLLNQGHTDNLGDKAILEVMQWILCEKGNVVISRPFIAYESPSHIVCGNETGLSRKSEKLDTGTVSLKQRANSLIGRLLPNAIVYIIKEKKAIRKILKQGIKIDAVIIGGGELLKSRHQFTYAFLVWTYYLKRLYKCPIAIWGISGDDHFSLLDKAIYRYVLKNSCYVGVRDKKTVRTIETIFGRKPEYAPDVVFKLQTLYPTINGKKNNSVICFLNSFEEVDTVFTSEEEYFEKFSRKIPKSASKIEIAFTTQTDYYEAVKLADYLKKNTQYSQMNICVGTTTTVKMLIAAINGSDVVISGRMHPMIIGLQLHKTVIPFTVKQKIAVFETEWKNTIVDHRITGQIDYQMHQMLLTLRKVDPRED